MNRTNLLVTSAVVAFVAATGASMAQQPQQDRAGPAEKAAPAEKTAPNKAPGARNQMPNGRAGEAQQNRGRSETTGQAPRANQQDLRDEKEGSKAKPSSRNSEQEGSKTKPPSRSERNQQNRTTGQAPREDQLNRAPDQNRTTGQAPREDRTKGSSEQNKSEQDREKIDRTQENRATTGQGAAGARATVNLTPEKRTHIHELIVQERNAPRVNSPNFNVTVGTRVPGTVRFRALPRAIVEIEPEWRGFEYFMVGDEIVVVDPRSKEIVAIIAA